MAPSSSDEDHVHAWRLLHLGRCTCLSGTISILIGSTPCASECHGLCRCCCPCACVQVIGVELQLPLRRMAWHEAMERYGTDKPDLRYGLEHMDVSLHVQGCGFKCVGGGAGMCCGFVV